MDRIVRHFLCLLIVTLLVSAGGIAPTQTLSTFLTYDDLVDDTPLKAPLKDRLEAAYSVANRHVVSAARPERLALAAQCCMKVIRLRKAGRVAIRYWPLHSVFSRLYPEILAPPPRHAITL
jgi:hypothetical protein